MLSAIDLDASVETVQLIHEDIITIAEAQNEAIVDEANIMKTRLEITTSDMKKRSTSAR